MHRNSRRTPIRLTTLKEARESVRSKSSTNYKPNTIGQTGMNKELTPVRLSRAAECFQTIHSQSIENNMNLIQKAEAVKEAFTSPVKRMSIHNNTSPLRQYSRENDQKNMIKQFLKNQLNRPIPKPKENSPRNEEENRKSEVISFIKGLEKLRYKLLKS